MLYLFRKNCTISGNSIFLDTNILIYLLQGDLKITELIDNKTFTISFTTELELLSIAMNSIQNRKIKALLKECYILNIEEIKNHTIDFRNKYNIKLPDAIVAATAHYLDLPLITADKGFKKIDKLNLFIYKI